MNAVTWPPRGTWTDEWISALGNAVETRYWTWFAAILTVIATNSFWGLDAAMVRDCDEARYGVAASEMLRAGSPLVTTYAGATEYWNLKPPLGYWLIEMAYRVLGPTPLALRLPAAVSSIAVTGLTMTIARRLAGSAVAVISGAVLVTSFGFVFYHGARSGELDMPLTLLLTCLFGLAEHLPYSRPARLAAGLILSIAFLLKSFALLPFVAALAAYLVLTRGPRSMSAWTVPALVLALVASVWSVARSVSEASTEFIRRMFLEDLVLRTTAVIDSGQHNGPFDYVWALGDRFAPWLLFIAAATWSSSRFLAERTSSDASTLLWTYALVPLALFSVAQTHHSWYILPTYPAWSIIGGCAIVQLLQRARTKRRVWQAGLLVLIGLLACEGRLVAKFGQSNMPASQSFLLSLPDRLGARIRTVDTAFVTTYSERFLLQVVDGFTVRDIDPAGVTPQRASPDGDVLLVRNRPAGGDPVAWPANVRVLATGPAYTVYGRSAAGLSARVAAAP